MSTYNPLVTDNAVCDPSEGIGAIKTGAGLPPPPPPPLPPPPLPPVEDSVPSVKSESLEEKVVVDTSSRTSEKAISQSVISLNEYAYAAKDQFAALDAAAGRDGTDSGSGVQWEEPIPLSGPHIEVIPFPTHVLPAPLRDMAKAIDETYGTPDGMAGSAILGAASIACRKNATIAIKADHVQYANIYVCIAASVATGKSPITKALRKPFDQWELEAADAYKQELREWEVACSMAESKRKNLENELRNPKSTMSEDEIRSQLQDVLAIISNKPVMRRILVEDFTGEALGLVMKDNGGFAALFSGEARKVLENAGGRYNSAGDTSLLLKSHAGDNHRVDRRGGKSYVVENAVLSATIMLQQDCLPMLSKSSAITSSGFIARWLFVVLELCASKYCKESIPKEILQNYENIILTLLDSEPIHVDLDSTALEAWKTFHDGVKNKSIEYEHSNPLLQQWLCKGPETVARFALILHCAKKACGERVCIAEEVAAGIELFSFFESHARRAFDIIGTDIEIPLMRRTWGWINCHRNELSEAREKDCVVSLEAVNARDLVMAGVAGIKKAGDAHRILQRLGEYHYLQHIKIQTKKGNPAEVHLIRPGDGGASND